MNTPSLDSLSHSPVPVAPARRWSAWLLPLAILLGFVLLFAIIFRDHLLPATPVEAARDR